MSKSLQDQLLELGLGREHKSGDRAAPGRKKPARRPPAGPPVRRSMPSGPKQVTDREPSLEDAFRLRDEQTRKEAAEQRERKRLEDRRRRELNRMIRTVVEPHRLNSAEAELVRHFLYKGRIRKVNVTADQLLALNSGEIGLVYLSGSYHLLPNDVVAKVAELSAEHVPDLAGSADEDPEFPVPDDLTW